MPTYQYACTECGEPLEVVQKFTDDALTECPACGGRLRKIFSPAAIVFRGSGFYRTDSRSGSGGTSSTSKETTKKDDTKAKSETKTETKSESKSSDSSSSSSSKSSGSSEKVA
ncbi:FmdB family transcriptional regulator [Actinoallomurus sp. NBC_01490]|uniref:FmdB family zinc ribbon protein n=1 Tax=Actinoallomurus sp. NBC_01490 TaxID=2903557 RepID=UPI002E340BA5|nr:FmdB family zinc ribbon protein [Actinoallomurus sp. NBC_01490]